MKTVLNPSARCPMVDLLRDHYRAIERHACQVLLMVRGTYRYQGRQPPQTDCCACDGVLDVSG